MKQNSKFQKIKILKTLTMIHPLLSRLTLTSLFLILIGSFAMAEVHNNHNKYQGPVTIIGTLENEKGQSRTVSFTIKPQIDCDNLITKIRGIDSVKVQSEETKSHEFCRKGLAVVHTAMLKTQKGKSGYVAIDVKFAVGSRLITAHHVLTVQSPGAPASSFEKQHIGYKTRDADGRKFMIMPSDPDHKNR